MPRANRVTAVVGAQWGDEGKGKMVYLLSADADTVMRYQGGANAGHTIEDEGETYKFRLIPSGILREHCTCIVGSGVALDPIGFAEELAELRERGALRGQLMVDRHAELVLSYHKLQDEYSEEAKGDAAVGTTRRGIGPAYADRHFRVGLRAGDILRPNFRERVFAAVARKNVLFAGYYSKPTIDPEELWNALASSLEQLAAFVSDGVSYVRGKLDNGGVSLLLEGAQGVLLDIDDGTYPFVTSSHPGSAGAQLGTGISWREINRVIGITKAYCTRVGGGPFPTELSGIAGDRLRETGKEFGTVTGRPRRCGCLDLPLLRYVARLNGLTELAVTKLDVLDRADTIELCTRHRYPGEHGLVATDWPDIDRLDQCVPLYTAYPGWQRPTGNIRRIAELPIPARAYLKGVEDFVGVPITMVSVGADTKAVATLHAQAAAG